MAKARFVSGPDELVPTRQTLLERLHDLGDSASWQEFFDTYWKLIYCAAVKSGLSDQEAEEVVQETVIGVARKMEAFHYDPQTCSFKGWLMLITRRRIIDRYRKAQPQSFTSLRGDTTTGGTALQIPDPAGQEAFEGVWDEEWRKNLVDAAMERVKRKVKEEHYQIFYLHHIKSMAARDIGELLWVSTARPRFMSCAIAWRGWSNARFRCWKRSSLGEEPRMNANSPESVPGSCHLCLFVWIRGWMQRLGRRAPTFRKYQVAPRLGTQAVRRRLLQNLRVTNAMLSGKLEAVAAEA